MNAKILLCDDTLEGLFSAIYISYLKHYDHETTRINCKDNYEMELFCDFEECGTSYEYAKKVARTIIREFGIDCYNIIYSAFFSWCEDRFNCVYHMVVHGFSMRNRKNLATDYANKYVTKVFDMARGVEKEYANYRGFLRFSQIKNGVLFSKIRPKNNIISFLAPHFSDRLVMEDFIIYDEGRRLFLLHEKRKECIIIIGEELDKDILSDISDDEIMYQELYKHFVNVIGISERKNDKLRRQMLPLRYRDNLTEFM